MMRRIIKPLLFVAALIPAAWLVYGTFTNNLGANPAETIQLTTGDWALQFLLITLAVTPLRRLTGWNVVIQYRRMLGLFAFFYACLHFTSYLVLDKYFDWHSMIEDVWKRPFITAGFSAFLLMVPLALTSTKGWIRRLGRRWQKLHRLIYASAICGAIHFIWKVKVVTGAPVVDGLILLVLLGFRVIWTLQQRTIRQAAGAVRPRNLPLN
jgi:methionine sulfoxide reductase heme-binding subunit